MNLAGACMLVLRQVVRRPTRSLLTIGGVAVAMFLFCAVQAAQRAVHEATGAARDETTLVVYRQNRYCPFTSRLPEWYADRIRAIPGVKSVVPMKIVVNNCRASLDVVTFRGVPRGEGGMSQLAARFVFLDGSEELWNARGDAAIIGEALAARRSVGVGDSFDAAGVTVSVAGIIDSDQAQDQNAAYVNLDFLQRASSKWGGVGVVTQFNVQVDDPDHLLAVAEAIDTDFAAEADPTTTRPEREFVARAAADIVQIVNFTQYLGWACLAAVLALIANAIILSVQDRVREHAILRTLGFRGSAIAFLIVLEGLLLGAAGGGLGTLTSAAILEWRRFSMTVEGVSMNMSASAIVSALGLAMSAALGIAAGSIPAIQASRRPIAECFRAV